MSSISNPERSPEHWGCPAPVKLRGLLLRAWRDQLQTLIRLRLSVSSSHGMGRRGSLLFILLLLLCYSSVRPDSRKRRCDVTQGWPWRYLERTQMPGPYCSSVRTGRGDVRVPPTHTKKLCRNSVNRKKRKKKRENTDWQKCRHSPDFCFNDI